LYRFLERVSGSLVNRLDRLNIDVGNDKVVGVEVERVSHLATFVEAKDSLSNNLGRVSVELIEGNTSNTPTNSRSNSLARITNKVRNLEDLSGLFWGRIADDIEVPVVTEFE
jgi:hypothetical protein